MGAKTVELGRVDQCSGAGVEWLTFPATDAIICASDNLHRERRRTGRVDRHGPDEPVSEPGREGGHRLQAPAASPIEGRLGVGGPNWGVTRTSPSGSARYSGRPWPLLRRAREMRALACASEPGWYREGFAPFVLGRKGLFVCGIMGHKET